MVKVSLNDRLEVRARPKDKPIMHQDWKDLLFLHWKYDPGEIQKTLPEGLFLDTFRGHGYLTVTAFFMENLSFADMPSIPGFSTFIEINVRTYVYDKNGIPGIWFYSLDINSFIASNAARAAFSLPYFFSDLKGVRTSSLLTISGQRDEHAQVAMNYVYKPIKGSRIAETNTLAFFLLERYVLFSLNSNQLSLQRVNHQPYSIQDVQVIEWNNDLLEANSFNFTKNPPDYAHFSPGVSVDIFNMRKI
jgi:uncharacterized protein